MPRPDRSTFRSMSQRAAIRVAKVLLLTYLGACAFLYFDQRNLLYFAAETHVAASETNFALRHEGVVLRGWKLNPGKSRALIYFGGNAEALGMERDELAAMFPDRTVYLLAYRGYGASDGTPDERALFSDALALYDDIRSQHVGIAVVGRSLGSGVGSYLASQRPIERLALVTPFASLVAAASAHYPAFPVAWLMKDRYESARYIRRYHGPILVLRAGRDEVVPAADTDRLLAAMRSAHSVVAFPGASHNSISDEPGYASALSGFMK
jgi:pimeloyl-ACP methyl ester carboxylesterase